MNFLDHFDVVFYLLGLYLLIFDIVHRVLVCMALNRFEGISLVLLDTCDVYQLILMV